MTFLTEIWHPNSKHLSVFYVFETLLTFFPTFICAVDKNGSVCISILHDPGDDRYGYEKASERWLPVHTVETILISVISMLADPNDESPANVDAAVSAPADDERKCNRRLTPFPFTVYRKSCVRTIPASSEESPSACGKVKRWTEE